ncbi:MAG TPA: response regulator transcription factor [Candidatus Limnocylindria bacterium]|jgi:two-component system response regulator RstA|nr:response regulator transcription factor [Candidatus Limnocylindria bacterium]
MLSSVAFANRQIRSDRPVLVVDDDLKIVNLVRTYLERDGFRVATAADGLAAIANARELQPQLVILDLMLPGLDGFAVMRAIRSGSPVPILMLSARGNTADRIAGIATGADDYLPKPFSPAELVVRVHAILRRAGPAESTSEPRHLADLVIDAGRREVRRQDERIDLTHAEFWMLVALVDAGGRVVSREAILAALYGQGEADVMDRTVDVYIRRLREKLGDDAEHPRYVATVRGAGYRAMIGA